MSETTIEITVSGDNAEETLAQIAAQLPETAEIITEPVLPPTLGELFANGVAASPELPARVSEWLASLELNPFLVLLICGAIFAAAYVLERILRAKVLAGVLAPEQADRPGPARIGAALRWGFVQILGLFIFYSIAWVATASVLPGMAVARTLADVTLGAVMIARVWYVILAFLAAPKDPSRRPTGLEDHEAKRIMRLAIWLVVLLFALELSRGIVLVAVDAGVSGALFVVMTRLIGGVAVTAFLIAIREPVRKLILLGWARDPLEPGMLVKFLSRFWHVFYIVLYLLQMAAEARGYLAGTFLSDAGSIKRSFAALVLLPFALAGLVIWRRQLRARSAREDSGIMEGLLALAEGALIIATSIFVLYSWDIDPFATDLQGPHRIVPGLVTAAITLVIGFSLWRTISVLLGGDVAAHGEEEGIPEDAGGKAGSRIETVLPVIRAVLAAFIGTITVLLALASFGVNIAPLLAGAGILGLAVGFGAQKVVEDVISGVLYLVEDAFRKGEYIETSEGKGIVEAIMLRSVRLRHHRGPVFTIPFSAMGTIQNHSRDWVTVKLSFEVSQDQDLEKVRKLVKRIGTELLEDPELEGQFLAPLKSQGAVALVGANYKIGVKFTSEPGKQFLIRRKALNAIQKAFRENNIELAGQRVVVDSSDHDAAAAAAKLAGDTLKASAAGAADER